MPLLIIILLAFLVFGIGATFSFIGHLLWLGILLIVVFIVVSLIAGLVGHRR